jgi:OOP family OmpA-OmpF porin
MAVFATAVLAAQSLPDAPFPRPYPGARIVESKRVAEPLEVKQATADAEAAIAGQSYDQLTFESRATQTAAVAAELMWYRNMLFAAGWKLLEEPKVLSSIQAHVSLSAHYRDHGRNIYTRITHLSTFRHIVNIADVGTEDWPSQLARECRVRIHSIHFELDRPIIREIESEPTLVKLADLLKSKNTPPVRIEGHVDNIGEAGAAARETLSLGRARMVAAWLTTQGGVPAGKVIAEGLGKSRPVAENDTDLGRALNRRIEVARQDCTR